MKIALNRYASSVFFQIFRTWPIYFLSPLIFLINAGCNKSNQAPQLTPNYNIYMAGTMEGKAVYWKNGVPVILSDSGSAYAIAINGSDIYACGIVDKGY